MLRPEKASRLGDTSVMRSCASISQYRSVATSQICRKRCSRRSAPAQLEAERSLRESEQHFKQLFGAASDDYWEMDAGLRVTYLSSNFEAIFGVPAVAQLGKRLVEAPAFALEPKLSPQFYAAITARKPYRDLVFFRRLEDGTQHWVEVSGVPVFGEDGAFLGYRGVGSDITAHRFAAEAARLAQGRLEDAVAHVRQPFVLYDAADCVLALNQAFADRRPDAQSFAYKSVSCREIAEQRLGCGFYAAAPEDEVIDLATLFAR